MKQLLLASAVAALSLSAFTAAHAAPEVYGRIWTDLGYIEDGDAELAGNARLGFKGSAPLNADIDAIYKLEYQYATDPVDANDNLYQRDIYAGLQSDTLGTVRVGRLVTADDSIAVSPEWSDFALSGFQSGYLGARWNSAIDYKSPKFNDLTVQATVKFGDTTQAVESYVTVDDKIEKKVDNETKDDSGSFVIGMNYSPTGMPFSVSASYADLQDSSVDNAIMLTGEYNVNDQIMIGAGYNITDYSAENSDASNNMVLLGKYQNTPKMYTYAQYDVSSNVGGVDGVDQNALSGGVWFDNTDRISTYASIGYADGDVADGFGVNTGMYLTF